MNSSRTHLFRRALVVAEVGRSPTPLRVGLSEFLPELEGLHVLAVVAARSRHWLFPRPTVPSSWSLAALVQELKPLAEQVTGEVSWDFEVDTLPEIARTNGAECLVLGPNAEDLPSSIIDLEQLSKSTGLPTVWLAAASVDD
ncbi:MAG TPA: hypothetical protein DEA08_15540, partial [Planctomycetes bacterium]|nr:hypothetical protein [Planctomycetota bacterium]